MKITNKSKKITKVHEDALLNLVAFKLKNRVLFPENVEMARKILKKARFLVS